MTDDDTRIDELARLIRVQQAEIDRLRRAVTAETPPEAAATRRRFLRMAGVTALGATGVGLLAPGASPAGASSAGAEPAGAVPADAADPYPQYVLDTGDTITGTLAVTGATSSATATEIGDGTHALTVFADGAGLEIDSKTKQRIRMQAQTRWDSDDDGVVGSGFTINNPATVWRQTGENHKGALLEIQQWLAAGPHESGVATNHPGTIFDVPRSDFYKIGWITAHYDSPNPVDTIHQHMNFETCNADLQTKITRFQISWGEDVALCSFPNSNVRLVYTDKLLSFGSGGQVRATYTDTTGRLDFTGAPVSFDVGQLRVQGHPVAATTFARKPADEQVVNLAQLQGDDDLHLTLEPGATYTFSAFLSFSSDAAADLRIAWQVPTGAGLTWTPDGLGITAGATTGQPKRSVAGTEAVPLGGVGAGVAVAAVPTGIVRTAAAGGTMRLLWSQNTASATATVLHADSYLQLTRVA